MRIIQLSIVVQDDFYCLSECWANGLRQAICEAAEQFVEENPTSNDITVDIAPLKQRDTMDAFDVEKASTQEITDFLVARGLNPSATYRKVMKLIESQIEANKA